MRSSNDPITGLRTRLLEWNIVTEDEIKVRYFFRGMTFPFFVPRIPRADIPLSLSPSLPILQPHAESALPLPFPPFSRKIP